ncbi:MAG: DUF1643 domain-containing protein [Bacteroidota bacterium]
MEKRASLSSCRRYRYALFRHWEDRLPGVLFVGLNPSSADEEQDDPTLRRCIRYAQAWGYGHLCMVNLYAFRHPSPKGLFKAADPIGPENEQHLRRYLSQYLDCVLIWGNHGAKNDRYLEVLKLIEKPLCLKINKNGQPAHPLYLKGGLRPQPYNYEPPHQ